MRLALVFTATIICLQGCGPHYRPIAQLGFIEIRTNIPNELVSTKPFSEVVYLSSTIGQSASSRISKFYPSHLASDFYSFPIGEYTLEIKCLDAKNAELISGTTKITVIDDHVTKVAVSFTNDDKPRLSITTSD